MRTHKAAKRLEKENIVHLFIVFLFLVLAIDHENKTVVEFQIVIKEKLEQGRSTRIELFVCLYSNCGQYALPESTEPWIFHFCD